jgi:hypothetical protein
MKNTTFKGSIIFIVLILICSSSIQAQNLLREVSLSDKINTSSLLVEGKVLSKQSFWDVDKKHIYTINKIEVYKLFKGNLNVSYVEIITKGGTVGLKAEKVHPSLQLQNENIGLFFLKNNNINTGQYHKGRTIFMPSTGAQSFYTYDLITGTASGTFQKYDDIESALYNDIYATTKAKYKEIKKFEIKKKLSSIKTQNQVSLAITSFSPASVSAGSKSILTINGSDFGANMGSVQFRFADNGCDTFYTALESQIISWADDKIEVEVPGEAGTGNIRVMTAGGGNTFDSPAQLTVDYAETNINSDALGTNTAYQTQHVNKNGNGGYIWRMHNGFEENDDAKDSFLRALDSWRCTTNIYWDIGDETDVDAEAMDGINVIRFDNGAELPMGTLGRCTSYYVGCLINNNSELAWYVDELDIVFDEFNASNNNGTNWQYGPALPTGNQSDFESVAVHELGHGHQLGHVINNNDFMHYRLTQGDSMRSLNDNNTAAANDVQSRSTNFTDCEQNSMGDFDCNQLSVGDNLLAASIIIFPNYAENEVFIRNNELLSLNEVKFMDVSGRMVKKVELKNKSLHRININELSTGLYFVQVKTEKGVLNKKLLVH